MDAEEREALRAMMVEVVGAATAELGRQLGGRIDELGVRLEEVIRRVDVIVDDLEDVERSLRKELDDLRTRIVQIARRQFREMKAEEDVRVRLGVLEKRLSDLESRGTLEG